MPSANPITISAFGNNLTMTMSSLEIATLVESRHDNVKQSIERLAKKKIIQLPTAQEVKDNQSLSPNSKTKVYNLEKRDSFVVVAQLSPEFTARLVDRWQELEQAQQTTPLAADTPATLALRDMRAGLQIAELLGCPKSYAIQTASQHAERLTGYPVTMLANQAAACQNVPAGDVMLEPTELGKSFDLSGAEMNQKLAFLGLQERIGGTWIPTKKGELFSARHAWTVRSKSGYNLKWNARAIEEWNARAIEDMIADQE